MVGSMSAILIEVRVFWTLCSLLVTDFLSQEDHQHRRHLHLLLSLLPFHTIRHLVRRHRNQARGPLQG